MVADEEKNLAASRAADSDVLSALDRIDCESFAHAVERANVGRAGRKGRNAKISDPYLARIARPLGGSGYAQQWWRYRHSRKPMPLIDKMIAAMVFEMRPQDLFPSWRFSVLTPVAPNVPQLARFIRILGALDERERAGLFDQIEQWLNQVKTHPKVKTKRTA